MLQIHNWKGFEHASLDNYRKQVYPIQLDHHLSQWCAPCAVWDLSHNPGTLGSFP